MGNLVLGRNVANKNRERNRCSDQISSPIASCKMHRYGSPINIKPSGKSQLLLIENLASGNDLARISITKVPRSRQVGELIPIKQFSDWKNV